MIFLPVTPDITVLFHMYLATVAGACLGHILTYTDLHTIGLRILDSYSLQHLAWKCTYTSESL